MGGVLYPLSRPPVPGAQPLDDIRSLFLHLNEADKLARGLGVIPLGDFLDESPEGELGSWHPIEEGPRTVRALAQAVRTKFGDSLEWAHNIDYEFASLEDCLQAGSKGAKEFRLVIT